MSEPQMIMPMVSVIKQIELERSRKPQAKNIRISFGLWASLEREFRERQLKWGITAPKSFFEEGGEKYRNKIYGLETEVSLDLLGESFMIA